MRMLAHLAFWPVLALTIPILAHSYQTGTDPIPVALYPIGAAVALIFVGKSR